MRTSDPRIGSDLLGYEIEEVIGRGGMGVVYRARDRALERNVALKLITPEYAGFTGFRGRFLAESRLAASLEHPNVVPIYGAGDQDGHLYIAMRYIEGRDLKQILLDGVLTPARAISICGQVASALDAAHAQGLVHRDVKPSNILIDASDRAYLADFGLSRLSSDPARVPGIGSSLGTIDYVAPEQIRGDAPDGRADVYALGCVLYECLTGSRTVLQPIRRRVAVRASRRGAPRPRLGSSTLWPKRSPRTPRTAMRPAGTSSWPRPTLWACRTSGRHGGRFSRSLRSAFVIAVAVVAGVLARGEPANQGAAGRRDPRLARHGRTSDPGRHQHGKRAWHVPDRQGADGRGGGRRWRMGGLVSQQRSLEGRSGFRCRLDHPTAPQGAVALAATKGAVYAVFDSRDGMEQIRPERSTRRWRTSC